MESIKSVSMLRRKKLWEQLELLTKRYNATWEQHNTTVDRDTQVTLEAKLKALEEQMGQIEADLAALTDTENGGLTRSSRNFRLVSSTSKPDTVINSGKTWAVLVGINCYEDCHIANLKAAVNDVTALHKLLASRYSAIRLLTDETTEHLPIRANILAELSSIARNADEGDLLLFHFSGHGIADEGKSYLLPRDAKTTAYGYTAVSMEDVRSIFNSSQARAKVVILDACHSGASIGRASTVMTRAFIQQVFDQAEGMVVLASCKQGQQSWEWPEKGHGVFTYYLLEALGGKADFGDKHFITVDDVSRYVTASVRDWAVDHSAVQTPTKHSEVVGDIVVMDFRDGTSD